MSGYPQTPTFPIDLRGGKGIKVNRTGPTSNTIVLDAILGNDAMASMAAGTLKANLLGSTSIPQDVTLQALGLRGLAYRDAAAIADVTGLQAALNGKQPTLGFTPENAANKGQPNGYAPLGSDGKVAATFLPPGNGGAITASQITDSSTSGRAVLTGTPAQGRAALEITDGSGNPVFDRQAAGGHSRTFTQIATDAVNIMEWLSDAMIAGTADAGPALNACMTYCRTSGRTTAVVPSFPGVILINTPVNYAGVHIMGPGRGGVSEAHFKTTADINTFYSDGPSTGLSGIRLDHVGNGLFVALPRALNHIVYDNMFYATNPAGEVSTATKAMIGFGGTNTFIRNNFFTNLRTNAYTIEAVRASDDIMINNSIPGNYFGGTGKGILVSAFGNYDSNPPAGVSIGAPRARQEGLEISSNQSILTGGALVEIASILNLRISNNMIDQSPTQGCIIFVPQGSLDCLGIFGVMIINNYISTAQDVNNGIGIDNYTGSGNYVQGVSVVGNEICFCGEGASFGANSGRITFSANIFHSIAKQTCVRASNATVAQGINFSKTNLFDGFALKIDTIGTNGQFRSTFSVDTATNDGNWTANAYSGRKRYINIPHLLGMTPALNTIKLECRPASDAVEAVYAHVISADTASVLVKIQVFGLASDTTITVAMQCAISGPNS